MGINRRSFLWLAGAASAAPPLAVALDMATTQTKIGDSGQPALVSFRAVTPLPDQPLPAYASYVLAGHVHLPTSSGVISQTVFAGGPASMSEIALPGLSRTVR